MTDIQKNKNNSVAGSDDQDIDIIRIPDPITGKITKVNVDENQLKNIKLVDTNQDRDIFHVPDSSTGKIKKIIVDKKKLKEANIEEFVIFSTGWEFV